MPSAFAIPSATEPQRDATRLAAFAAVFAIILFRILLVAFDRTELSTDEAQYWFWGQSFEFGAYSKPPLIGWILRASTELLGQSVAAVRLPAVLLHAATALVLFQFTCRISSAPVALIAALSYLTTPAVALGSALMTTDTPMLLAAAVAMSTQAGLAQAREQGRRTIWLAVVFGLALGVGLLAKHAMLFWLVGALAAAALSPSFRIRLADAGLAMAVMLAVVSPHLWWLVQHGFVTLHHVQDITQGSALSALRPMRFGAEQFAVMGPVLVIAMLLAAAGRVQNAWRPGLAALALTPLLIVLIQAVKGPVLANWAALYLVPGSVLAALWLDRHRELAKLSLLLGLGITLALPLVKVFGTGLAAPDGRLLLARYLGHADTARWAFETAQAAGARTLIAQERSLMADLSWFGASAEVTLRAVPPRGKPSHHWEMTAPFNPERDPGPVLLLWPEGQALACDQAPVIGRHEAEPGAYAGRSFVLLRLDAPHCLVAGAGVR